MGLGFGERVKIEGIGYCSLLIMSCKAKTCRTNKGDCEGEKRGVFECRCVLKESVKGGRSCAALCCAGNCLFFSTAEGFLIDK